MGAILLFMYRENIWSYLSSEAQINANDVSYSPQISLSETIDIKILNDPLLDSLQDQAKDFDYDNVCYRPITVLQTSEGPVSTQLPGCIVGNKLPFEEGDGN